MNGAYKLVLTDKIIKTGMFASAIIIAVELIYIGFLFLSLPPLLPVFNQLPWGPERLGPKISIFIPTGLTFAFLVLNFFAIARLHEQSPLLSRIISITTLLISVLSLIFVFRTLQLIV